jgi:hypothetical protein
VQRLRSFGLAGCVVAATALAAPGVASAQYQAPPPDPGFSYIFDGSATGSDASFDKWAFAGGTFNQSRPASEGGQGQATLNTTEGAIQVNNSPFGGYWYPVKPFGDAVLRLQYTVQNTPEATRNGGVMIRSPEIRYSCPDATGQRVQCATTNDVLALKPAGYNYDVCGAALPLCGRTTPAESTSYSWAGASGPFPPASNSVDPPHTYTGPYCARPGAANQINWNSNTAFVTHNNNASNNQHWTQVMCGHEIQINESLTGGGPNPSSDPIKTGSVYGFRNLNSKQSGTYKRLEKGVWHEMEIRMIGQQYTVLVDGEMINQFDNSVPKVATRSGDPSTAARQFARGYLGLQTHGGNDRINYREIQVKEIASADIPVNTVAPSITGSGFQGNPLRCNHGTWTTAAGSQYFVKWYRSNKIGPEHPRFWAPSQMDLGNVTTPAEAQYGTSPLTWLDSMLVGEGDTYTPTAEDVGKVVHCAVNVDNGGATVWKTAKAPEILAATNTPGDVSGTVPATLSLTLGAPASFGPFTPGLAKTYEASTSATVLSTAGDATLSVADPSSQNTGHLVNGSFFLSQPLQARARNAANTGTAYNNVGSTASPLNLLTYDGPVTNDAVTLGFSQRINANDALRTGSYSKTLTFTLSTTQP